MAVGRILWREFFQCFVNDQQGVRRRIDRQVKSFKLDALKRTAAFPAALLAGVLDQNTAHRLGRAREEVHPVLSLIVRSTRETQIRFVDQRGRLQRLAGRLMRHFRRRQLAQLFIDEREQFLGGLGVALLNAVEDCGARRSRAHSI